MAETPVIVDYTNYRGERSERRIMPIHLGHYSNEWHPEPQWLLLAHDLDKDQRRTFAMKDIHSWRVVPSKSGGADA